MTYNTQRRARKFASNRNFALDFYDDIEPVLRDAGFFNRGGREEQPGVFVYPFSNPSDANMWLNHWADVLDDADFPEKWDRQFVIRLDRNPDSVEAYVRPEVVVIEEYGGQGFSKQGARKFASEYDRVSDLPEDYELITDSQDIEATLDNAGKSQYSGDAGCLFISYEDPDGGNAGFRLFLCENSVPGNNDSVWEIYPNDTYGG
jgi:hypothetical protein